MILIKDNHVDFAGGIAAAVERAKAYCKENGKDLKIEQEVRNTDEIRQAIAAGVDRIMLDFVSVGALTHSVKGLDMSFKAC